MFATQKFHKYPKKKKFSHIKTLHLHKSFHFSKKNIKQTFTLNTNFHAKKPQPNQKFALFTQKTTKTNSHTYPTLKKSTHTLTNQSKTSQKSSSHENLPKIPNKNSCSKMAPSISWHFVHCFQARRQFSLFDVFVRRRNQFSPHLTHSLKSFSCF